MSHLFLNLQLMLLLLLHFLSVVSTFNLDFRQAQIHRRPGAHSAFGYSLDFAYRDQRRHKFTLLVGAPFAQTAQRRLQKTGAVYGCEVDNQQQNACAEIIFDQKGNELRLNGSHLLPIEEKSHQMFGATIVASKDGDSVLACAPHYKYFFAKFEVIEPVGSCYYARDHFNKIQEYAPCRQEPARHGRHRLGYGMCGFSAAVPDKGDQRLFISGPGVWYWQGSVFSQNIQNLTDRPGTADGPAHTDHHQLGYSTATGDFDGDGKDDIVVGVPRGNELIGMVSIYTRELKPIVNITERDGQRGQYFGGSVAVLDLQRVSGQAAPAQSSNLAEVGTDLSAMTIVSSEMIALQQKDFVGFIMLKNLLEIEQNMRRIRYSQRPVPESFYEKCDSFESIFARKLNLLEMADKFSAKTLQPAPSTILEKIYKFGSFCIRPVHMAMDLLCVFEIGKTFSFFEQLGINDKIALCSNIAMPLYVLCNGFYSVQQNCEVLCTPGGVLPIKCFKTSFYHKDSVAMRMGDKLLCKAIEPFSRLKLSNEEFVLIRAIIYSHMVSPGLSDQAQKLLFTEAEKYASLLMRIVQISYGAAPGALRYVELMGLIECVFNAGAKHRQLLTYISNVLDPNFDRVMPPMLAKISTKGPVELHQLLPY